MLSLKQYLIRTGAIVALAVTAGTALAADDASPWPPEWDAAAASARISPALLYATALANSGVESNGRLTVWPWTVRIDGAARRFRGAGPAAAAARWAADRGKDVALGLFALRVPGEAVNRSLLRESAQLVAGAAQIADCLESGAERAVALGRCLDPTATAPVAADLGRRILRMQRAIELGPPAPDEHRLCGVPQEGVKGRIAALVIESATRHGIDPAFALGIARSESALRHAGVRSHAGAIGAMQLMPGTAKRFGVDPYVLEENIDGGMRYLAILSEMFDDVPALVAAAYNAGEGAVQRYRRRIPPFRETQTYVPRVLAARRQFACQ
jgi:soluble lytic murein transglycosylase-like protein